MEAQAYDIKNSKEVILLAFGLAKTIKEAKENDGKIDFMDASLLMALFPKFGPAFEDIALVPAELKDLSVEESEELKTLVLSEFSDIVDEAKIIEQINLGFEAMICIYKLVQSFK